MQVKKIGDFYQIAQASGQRHNFLAIGLTQAAQPSGPSLEPLPAIKGIEHERLDPTAIARAVHEGVRRANRTFGTNYSVTAIRYVENDTPPEEIYAELAYRIIAALVAGN